MTMRTFHIACLTLLVSLGATPALAADWQLSRMAGRLELAAGEFSDSVSQLRGYGGVSQQARQLSRKAEQLADSANKQRSDTYLRSKFAEVTRNYRSLESAFLRVNSNYGSRYASSDFDRIARLYSQLSEELYYGDGYPGGYYPDRDSYALRLLTPPRVYIAPPIVQYERREQRNDRDPVYGYDHRSPVLERQQQRERERHDLLEQRNPGSRRDNHYEGNNGVYRLGGRP